MISNLVFKFFYFISYTSFICISEISILVAQSGKTVDRRSEFWLHVKFLSILF